MSALAKNTQATLISNLSYHDARAAIDWLCKTFGFEKRSAYEGEDGSIAHAELAFGNGMVMIGSINKQSEFGRWVAHPQEIGGRETQTVYVITDDLDEIHRRVQASGVEILMKLEDKGYGGRGFSCRDLEGHVWSFGTYDPWDAQT
jgi:uncharacterized glyoxalase superfamily protein PhnB